MGMHEEIWITKLFNDHLAGLGNAALNLVGWPSVAAAVDELRSDGIAGGSHHHGCVRLP